jgi:hypothetical protein
MRGDRTNNTAYPDSFYDLFEKSHTDLKSYIGNQASVDVKIIIVDNGLPVVSVVGDDTITLEASKYKVYNDDGAICSDQQTNALYKATPTITLAAGAKYLGTVPDSVYQYGTSASASATDQSEVTYNCANCVYTITYTCVTASSVSNQANRTVTVLDRRDPVVAIRQPIRYTELVPEDQEPSDSEKIALFDRADIVTQDNLGNVSFVNATLESDAWPLSFKIKYEYEDHNSNKAYVTRTVKVRDTTLPVINLTLGQLTLDSDNEFPKTEIRALAIAPAQGNVWMFAAIASAVTGVAMFSLQYVRRSPSIEV